MAPRKAKPASATPTAPRRSARLASRSPSVEPQEQPVSRVKKAKATPTKKPAPPQSPETPETGLRPYYGPLSTAEKENRHTLMLQKLGMSKGTFKLKMLEIERIVDRDREEEAAAAREAEARAAETQNNLPSPPNSHSAAEQQQPASAPPVTTSSTTPPSTVGRAAGWVFNSISSLFRKRQAEEPVEQAPSAKRTRIEAPQSTSSSTSSSPTAKKARTNEPTSSSHTITKASEEVSQTKATSRAGKPVKTVKRKRDKEPVTAPSPPSSAEDTEEQEREHTTPQQSHAIPEVYLTQSQAADESDHEPAPTPTPRRILTPKSPRDYGVPSVRHPGVPTSLSTITEYTEPSQLSNLSESIMEDTPSKAPRQQPPSNNLQVPQSTPARRQPTTPSMRRSAQLRAARSAGNTTPRFGLSGTAASAPPKPRESNADTRLAKVQLRDKLQRQLDELNKDEDIMEMDSHRVKRVKIDNLVEIPHNRPGDPAGCFRFPEEDSDDEMEVYENVEERENVFDYNDVTMDEEEESTMVFDFPDVGPVPADYHVTEEFKEAAGRLFTEGFNAWLLAA